MNPLISSVGHSGFRVELHRIDSIPAEYIKPTLDYNATHSILDFYPDGTFKGSIEIELIGSESLIPSDSLETQHDVITSLWCKIQDRARAIRLDAAKEEQHKNPYVFTIKEVIEIYEEGLRLTMIIDKAAGYYHMPSEAD